MIRSLGLGSRDRILRVKPLATRARPGGWRSAYRVELARQSWEVWADVRLPEGVAPACDPHPWTGEGSASLGLVLAMQEGVSLSLPRLRSRRLRAGIPEIQATLRSMFPDLHQIALHERGLRRRLPAPPRRGTGVFFSGGIDSFYSLVTNRPGVGILVAVHGFDVAFENASLWRDVRAHLAAAASALGCGFIEVETNLRQLLHRRVNWEIAHGAALAWVATLLTPVLERALIAATHRREQAVAWGSHPDLDPLWSSEALEIVHDGTGASRAEKAARLAGEPEAMRHLRVCWQNPDGAYNCGVCRKCVVARVTLDSVGALERCATLHGVPTPEEIEKLEVELVTTRGYLESARDAYRRTRPAAPQLAAIERALARVGGAGS